MSRGRRRPSKPPVPFEHRACTVYDVDQLRKMLWNITWRSFLRGPRSALRLNDVMFYARIGIHMGRPAIAIIAQGKFVMVRYVSLKRPMYGEVILSPLSATDPEQHGRPLYWGEELIVRGQKPGHAARVLKGIVLERSK